MRLKIAVLNLQSGIGVTKGYGQYFTRGWRYLWGHPGEPVHAAAQMLDDEKPDIVLASEIDEPSRRSQFKSHIEILKKANHLIHSQFFPTKVYGTAIQEGSAILSTFPFLHTQTHTLTAGMNPRVLGHTTIELNGTTVHLYVAHLALGKKRRTQQVQEISSIIGQGDSPIILAGDFNERKEELHSMFSDIGLKIYTEIGYPSWRPVHSLQALFLSEHFTLVHKYQPTADLFSDHIPLIAEVEI